ncbi:putative zinc-binding protein [bacterium]|nr:putative zinc-binding protein [bacterium]
MSQGCDCKSEEKLIFACSGAADVGELSDRAARVLTKEGSGKMFCMAGIGGRVSGIIKTTEAAAKILAVDGCPLDCVKNSLEQAGFNKYKHLRVTDLGMEKGKSEINQENIEKIAVSSREKLSG